MYVFDPLLCYENLDSENAREVIGLFNREVEEIIGDNGRFATSNSLSMMNTLLL